MCKQLINCKSACASRVCFERARLLVLWRERARAAGCARLRWREWMLWLIWRIWWNIQKLWWFEDTTRIHDGGHQRRGNEEERQELRCVYSTQTPLIHLYVCVRKTTRQLDMMMMILAFLTRLSIKILTGLQEKSCRSLNKHTLSVITEALALKWSKQAEIHPYTPASARRITSEPRFIRLWIVFNRWFCGV